MKWWEYTDLLSVEAKLYLQGKNRHVTRFGIFLSLISLICVSVLSLYFLVIFFQQSQVNVIYFEQQALHTPFINLTDSPFSFSLLDQTLKPVDPSFVEIIPAMILTTFTGASRINLETQPCKEVSYFINLPLKDQESIADFRCMKENKYILNITYDPENYKGNYINFYTMRCVNSTLNNNRCKSAKEIDDYLLKSQMYLRYNIPIYSINHFNISDPIFKGWAVSQDAVITNLFYNRKILFKLTNYTTDYGSVLQETETVSAYGIDPIRSKIEILAKAPSTINPNTLGMHSFQPITESFDNYNRSYMKLQTIVAYIGGIIKFVFTIAQIISKYVTSQMLFIHLGNFFADISEGKKFENCEKNQINQNYKLSKKINHSGSGDVLNQEGNFNKSNLQMPNAPNNLSNLNAVNTSVNNFLNISNKQEKLTDTFQNSTPNKKRWRITLNTNFKQLSLIEAILPKVCYKNKPHSMKHIVSDCETIMRSKLSSDFMLKIFSEFEMIKNVLFNDEQRIVFDNLSYPNLDCHLESMKYSLKNIIQPEKLEDIVRNLESCSHSEDKINSGLLNLLK
jgi:hypothetical protein